MKAEQRRLGLGAQWRLSSFYPLTLSRLALVAWFVRISVYIYIVQMGVFGVLLGVGMDIMSHYGLSPVN